MMPDPSPRQPASRSREEDRLLLRAAAEISRELSTPRPLIYWTDCLGSALIGYAALTVAIVARSPIVAGSGVIVAILALYRAVLFIHELTHLRRPSLPGFHTAWNLAVGVPLLVPSFIYEGVHTEHHVRTKYGTTADPEYLPFAHMGRWSLPLFLASAMLAPVALVLRFAVLAPLSLVSRRLRDTVVRRFSALVINPAYVRRPPAGEQARDWLIYETAASLWAIALVALAIGVPASRHGLLLFAVALAGVAVLNQVRTAAAHLWTSEGEELTLTAQFLDSVNVPSGGVALLWAPVGLRFHALHHLLPSLPYHALAEAHRRLSSRLPASSAYQRASFAGLRAIVGASRHRDRPGWSAGYAQSR